MSDVLQNSSDGSGKAPYRRPGLHVYGDLRTITAGTKGGTKGDGPDNPGGPSTRVVA